MLELNYALIEAFIVDGERDSAHDSTQNTCSFGDCAREIRFQLLPKTIESSFPEKIQVVRRFPFCSKNVSSTKITSNLRENGSVEHLTLYGP
uniref:Uncharacterized protein n=1 Tax=Bursaphelenchus xylophilus TaxID=6326 RepID=A0A1I7SLL8_BURXY